MTTEPARAVACIRSSPAPATFLVATITFGSPNTVAAIAQGGMYYGIQDGCTLSGMGISVSGNTFSIAAGTFSTPVDETTTYVYGSNLGLTASTVPIYSNDLLRAVIDPGSGNTPQDVANASTTGYNRVEYQYNTQGQQVEVKDQNGTIHDYIFDLLGRETEDEVRALGTGIDAGISDPVLRIQQGYDLLGDLVDVRSYNNATVGSGTVLNEVFRQYDDWGDLTAEYQNTTEAATNGDGNVINATPYVGYVYDDGVTGSVTERRRRLVQCPPRSPTSARARWCTRMVGFCTTSMTPVPMPNCAA